MQNYTGLSKLKQIFGWKWINFSLPWKALKLSIKIRKLQKFRKQSCSLDFSKCLWLWDFWCFDYIKIANDTMPIVQATIQICLIRQILLQCSVPEGDLHCQCILSIFRASVHQFYANILVSTHFFILTTNLHCSICYFIDWLVGPLTIRCACDLKSCPKLLLLLTVVVSSKFPGSVTF